MSDRVSDVATKCLERDFLDTLVLEAIVQSKEDADNAESAQVLLGAVENAVERDPRAYDAFIAILEETLTGDDGATLVSEMKRELQVVRDREHLAEGSDVRAEQSKPTLEATKVGIKVGAKTSINSKSAENGQLISNGSAPRPKRPTQVQDHSNERCTYVGNPPPEKQVQENLENARVLIQSARCMQNTCTYQELQEKCDQLENDHHERKRIKKKLTEKCKALEGLVEEKERKIKECQCQLDAMKKRLSGVESLKHGINSEYAALQERMATMQAEYESRIEAETDKKNELARKLKQNELKIAQSNSDIERMMAEIEQLRQQNKCLHEENCELKKARQDATEIGVLLTLAMFIMIALAVLAVGAYVFSFGSEKRDEL